MSAWINFAILIISSVLFTVFYVLSVSPVQLEKHFGPSAYGLCAKFRIVASLLMIVVCVNYVLYYWYPLPVPLPLVFPWPWWLSVLIAVVIVIPSMALMLRGVRDAGEETMAPKPEHRMYRGIYEKIRHPQAVGELPLWWVIAFLVHSPFLVLFSFVYVPVWYGFCVAEERDLLLRYGEAYEKYRREVGFWWPRRKHGG